MRQSFVRIDKRDKNENNPGIGREIRKGILPLKSLLCLPALETTVRCRVAAAALMRCSAETIALARRQPVSVGRQKMPISFLKHAEDQTVLALMTVLRALEQESWQMRSYTDWGVVAAPNLFGRVSIAQTIQRYQQEGAWGVSPHLIPHQSLHAMSGTISQALKIYGPNFGISGAPNAGPDALLIAGAMMMDGVLPGLWLVLAGHETEWIPAADGSPVPTPMCQAIALALTSGNVDTTGIYLSLGQTRTAEEIDPAVPEFHLDLLAEDWLQQGGIPQGRWRLSETHWVELETVGTVAEVHP
jgi:hypothetical protein